MGPRLEKPLIRLGKQTLLERTAETIKSSNAGEIIVATSPATPKTGIFAMKQGMAVLETPGNDYHDDVYFLLDRFGPYLSVNVDIPFLTKEAINRLLVKSRDVSIACVIPRAKVSYSVAEDSVGKGKDGAEYVWIGLNYVTPTPETELLVMEDDRLAININTPLDLAFAARMLAEERRKKG
jgi:adenosylcobinamide-phosphate guanylyltransferase